MNDLGFWIFITVITVAFCGEPDLMDSIIHDQGCGILNENSLSAEKGLRK